MTARLLLTLTASVLALCAAMEAAHAGGDLTIHLVSEHSGHKPHLNEENYGIGYTGDGELVREYLPLCARLQCRGSVGYYTNSWFRDSLYVGVHVPITRNVSVSGLLVTGYSGRSAGDNENLLFGELMPFAALNIDAAPHWRASPVLSIGPTVDGGVFLLSLRTTLGKHR